MMLEQVEHDSGVTTLQSPRLRNAGVVHAFSTRRGGVSEGPYATLNLGTLTKGEGSDFNTSVAENYRRFRHALGCERMVRVTVRQVHGGAVWVPPSKPVRPDDAPEADAMVTDQRGQLLTIRTADCVPVLLASRDGNVIAAAHAGWRGIVAGVVDEALRTMQARFEVAARDMVAAVGPSISAAHYQVGPEVVSAFEDAGLADCAHPSADAADKAHVNIGGAVRRQLERAGVDPRRIDTTDACTYRDQTLFYSYRRDGARSGRLAAVIARPA